MSVTVASTMCNLFKHVHVAGENETQSTTEGDA